MGQKNQTKPFLEYLVVCAPIVVKFCMKWNDTPFPRQIFRTSLKMVRMGQLDLLNILNSVKFLRFLAAQRRQLAPNNMTIGKTEKATDAVLRAKFSLFGEKEWVREPPHQKRDVQGCACSDSAFLTASSLTINRHSSLYECLYFPG